MTLFRFSILSMAHRPTVDAYNKIAEEFHLRNGFTILVEEYKKFSELLGNNKKIIEIGCGTGRDAQGLMEEGLDYTGVDASKEMLKVAKEHASDAYFQVGDFYNLDFPDKTFDGFWAAASFLHVPKNEISQVLKEAKRIIKEGGIGFISLKQKTQMDEGVIKEEKAGGIERYFAFYTESEFKDILKKNGFEVILLNKRKERDEKKTIWLCFFVRKT